jgi:hypothetical protein
VLTTQQLYREIEASKETTENLIDGLREILDEKFASVNRQLELVEQQRVEQKSDTKAAVDAALTAQKEAVKEQTTASERAIAKSEASTTKQLEQLTATFQTAIRATDDKVAAVSNRLTTVEAIKQGSANAYNGLYIALGASATILGLLILFANYITGH